MKKLLSIIAVTGLMFSVNTCASANNQISVYLDGERVEFDVLPQIIDGRTMVPIRAIFEKMGAEVLWDNDTATAVCTKGDTIVKMTVNSTDMYINDKPVIMDVSPTVIDGRCLTPARYVAEAFGAEVMWDQEANRVVISTANDAENKTTLYSCDGRTIEVSESEVEAYLNVGWYRTKAETMQNMYAPDGRVIEIYKDEKDAYKNVGWYESSADALRANKPKGEHSDSSDAAGYGYYYRTPSGKKYHIDPDCGGKNSYRTTNISQLEPCSKCAK